MKTFSKNKIKNKKGMAIIELGLTMGIVLLIMLGTIDVAQVFITYNDLLFSLREGLNKATISTIAEGKKTTENTFNETKFFKSSTLTKITTTQSKNNLGQPFCFTGEVEINTTYKGFFPDNKLTIKKTSCIIQEVNNLQ